MSELQRRIVVRGAFFSGIASFALALFVSQNGSQQLIYMVFGFLAFAVSLSSGRHDREEN